MDMQEQINNQHCPRKLNVLVLNYEFPPLGGGAAPVSKELASRIAEKGHHVDVVTMRYKDLPEQELVDGVHVYRVNCLRKKKFSCQPWEQLSYLLSAKKILNQLMASNDYDFCHAHFIVPTGVLARYLKKKYGLKYILTAHGSDVEGYNKKKSNKMMLFLLRPFWKSIVKESERTFSPSKFLDRLMKKQYRGDYAIIPNGVDLTKYNYNCSSGKEQRIIFVGRLQWTKNVQALIKAISLISLNGWKVDIVGDGPYRKELEKLVTDNHLNNVVIFHGWVTNGSDEHMEYLRKASLFVSMSYFESFGVSVVEAAAMGCDLLLSDIEAHRMLIKNENCFVTPDDYNALAYAIKDYIDKKIDLHIDRESIERFDWKSVADAYEKEYERVCM